MGNVILVGWINKGKAADCGETMKNQLLVRRLSELGVGCRQMDFKGWRKRPWVFLQFGWNLLAHREDTLIFSTSTENVYGLMKWMKRLRWKQNTVHWVIGGSLGQRVQRGIYSADVIGSMKHTLVESPLMAEQLEAAGVKGVKVVPNFKPIPYYPKAKVRYPDAGGPLKFVFLSRIMPEKGCDNILEAARLLNEAGLESQYQVDFWGKIADGYREGFLKKVAELENVQYRGFLNLEERAGYDRLSSYDMMLFPTYWKGEGFAGVFIDAFISGLPILATDWAHNRRFLTENETALFVPVHDVIALKDKMEACIHGQYDLTEMSRNCRKQAEKYNVTNVVTERLLQEIGVISCR
ncbi:MAG: glycosyltransferase [Clostridiales bacterium]|nr:glycosyltransferase [Clostridiales bacterium]